MKQLELLFSNEIILDDNRSMKLDYCLTEKLSDADESIPIYGIHIKKLLGDIVETDEVTALSYSKDKVTSILRKLFQHEVTPVSMIEIVDELVTQAF